MPFCVWHSSSIVVTAVHTPSQIISVSTGLALWLSRRRGLALLDFRAGDASMLVCFRTVAVVQQLKATSAHYWGANHSESPGRERGPGGRFLKIGPPKNQERSEDV